MFEVIYMIADYEPWWMFEGWEETIQTRHEFDNEIEAKEFLAELLAKLRAENTFELTKKEIYHAFWSTEEKTFCLGCDEDLQVYHGVIFNRK